jgi:NADP-dependent 3-hydroxy acid dehydrogenase YdfG
VARHGERRTKLTGARRGERLYNCKMSEAVAIITGGAGDLARAIARTLDEHGFQVYSPGKEELNVTEPASVRDFFPSASAWIC